MLSKELPLKVLHIIASVDRRRGGPVQGLAQGIPIRQSWGQHIETVTLDSPCAPWISEFPGVVHGLGPGTKPYGYTPKLAAWIAENGSRFDAAVIHGLWNHSSVGGWQGLRRARLPYVLFTHGMMDPWFRKAKPVKHWIKQVFWAVQGRVLRDANKVLFTSEEEMRLAEGVFFGYSYRPHVVAYAGADATTPGPDDEAAFRALVPNLGDRPYLLFLSRIHEKKGVDLLLEGFAKAARRPELQLVIAGPPHGDLGVRLNAQARALGISNRVHWPGMLKAGIKAAAFQGAEAFVLTSHQENFGIAVAEALAYGKPVLISNQINIWREIQAGGSGIVGPDTIKGATQVIAGWEALTPETRLHMGLAARMVYEQNFTVEAAARDLTKMLERAASARLVQ